MWFNKALQNEIAALNAELHPLKGLISGIDEEMLVLKLRKDRTISYMNQNFLNEFGYPHEKLIDAPFQTIITTQTQSFDSYKKSYDLYEVSIPAFLHQCLK
jgi:methyl-accepting chemotaxis protein